MTSRVGSLCSGFGGLELGLMSVVDAKVVWHAEIDPYASRVLEARWPGVPNLGDIAAVDWSAVEPVEWLTAGWPCQPISQAGKQLGMGDERWLWDEVVRAVAGVRPRRVLLENVPRLLTLDGGRPFERVVCDLAALGYVGRWGVVRAADTGAPHARARIFVLATDARCDEPERRGGPDLLAGAARPGEAEGAERKRLRHAAVDRDPAAADATDDGRERHQGSRGRRSGPANGRLGSPVEGSGGTPADASGSRREGPRPEPARLRPERGGRVAANTTRDRRDEGRAESAGIVGGSDAAVGGAIASDADRGGLAQRPERDSGPVAGEDGARRADVVRPRVEWGSYEPAIRRWERITGQLAPPPTEPRELTRANIRDCAWDLGLDGWAAIEYVRRGWWGAVLSPPFVEWMQGLPSGWVTAVPDIPRNQQLKILGNGVVPQQAALALRLLRSVDVGEGAA